jgi:hypothetical protein
MQEWRRRGIGTPAGWYTLIGLALLGASIWVPFLTAERSARVEQRADQISGLLLEAIRPLGQLDGDSVPVILGRFHRLALRDRVHVGDLEPLAEPLPGTLLCLANKHYAFHVAVSPPEETAVRGPDTEDAYEALAWPLSEGGPGHGVFFHPDDALRAYTRNLNAGYHGFGERRPEPGRCHRRDLTLIEGSRLYRSAGDERWILY